MTSPPDISHLLRQEVARLGFELVDLRLGGPPHRRSVRVRIDRPASRPGTGVTSEDCVVVARALQAWFPTAAPQETVESLEVSSPGIERPIRWPEHWRRYVGSRVRIRAAGAHHSSLQMVICSLPKPENIVGAGPLTLREKICCTHHYCHQRLLLVVT